MATALFPSTISTSVPQGSDHIPIGAGQLVFPINSLIFQLLKVETFFFFKAGDKSPFMSAFDHTECKKAFHSNGNFIQVGATGSTLEHELPSVASIRKSDCTNKAKKERLVELSSRLHLCLC